MRRLAPVVTALLVLASCSEPPDDTASTVATTAPTTTTTTAAAATTTTTPTTTTTTAPTTTTTTTTLPLESISISLQTVAAGFERPILAIGRPGDDRLFVADQEGTVWAVRGEARSLVLDLRDPVRYSGEQGLLGLAFHPEDPERMIVHYSDTAGDTVVEEYRLPLGTDRADPMPVQTILTVDQPASNHNGGMIAFGPDGLLYIGLGDGGGGGDPFRNGQDPSTLLGAILRLDLDGGAPYAIPAGNPFADGVDGAPEVWVYGLRNPWRFAFDGGDLWIGDVGQNRYEEIDRITIADGGANLGWPILEATHCYDASAGNCDDPTLVAPVHEYAHGDSRCSVTGGLVYRGSDLPGLTGTYLFSDWCSGEIVALRIGADGSAITRVLAVAGPGVASFGTDGAGEVYVMRGDAVLRIVPAG